MHVEFTRPGTPHGSGCVLIAFAIEAEGLAIEPGELDDSVIAALASAAACNGVTGARDKLVAIAGIAGLALGLGMACKFTCVMLVPPMVLLIAIRAIRHARETASPRRSRAHVLAAKQPAADGTQPHTTFRVAAP